MGKGWLLGALLAIGCGGVSVDGKQRTSDAGDGVTGSATSPPESGPGSQTGATSGAGGSAQIAIGESAAAGLLPSPAGWAGTTGYGYPVGGSSGLAGSSSAGAASDADCSSPPLAALADWAPRGAGANDSSAAQALADARRVLAGSWHGVATTPWTAPYAVVTRFSAQGGYSAHCAQNSDYDGQSNGCCRAFYYGSDQDSALKRWALSSVNEASAFNGTLDIAFCYDGEACYAPAWQGEIVGLDYDATGNRARFELWTSDGHGPIKLDLERDE